MCSKELRSKRELIEKFIDENLPKLNDSDDVPEAFEDFVYTEQEKAYIELCKDENADPAKLKKVIDEHLFSNQSIKRDDVIESLKETPKLLERKSVATRIIDRVYSFVDIFVSGMAA